LKSDNLLSAAVQVERPIDGHRPDTQDGWLAAADRQRSSSLDLRAGSVGVVAHEGQCPGALLDDTDGSGNDIADAGGILATVEYECAQVGETAGPPPIGVLHVTRPERACRSSVADL